MNENIILTSIRGNLPRIKDIYYKFILSTVSSNMKNIYQYFNSFTQNLLNDQK